MQYQTFRKWRHLEPQIHSEKPIVPPTKLQDISQLLSDHDSATTQEAEEDKEPQLRAQWRLSIYVLALKKILGGNSELSMPVLRIIKSLRIPPSWNNRFTRGILAVTSLGKDHHRS